MAKTPKVVPLQEDDRRLIAADEKTKRFILGIGKQRIAFDFTTRVTNLPPAAGGRLVTRVVKSKAMRCLPIPRMKRLVFSSAAISRRSSSWRGTTFGVFAI